MNNATSARAAVLLCLANGSCSVGKVPTLPLSAPEPDIHSAPSRIIRVARPVRATIKVMADPTNSRKQNVTVSLRADTIQKARVLAARRSTSISGLLAEQIELLVGAEEAYERSERAALAILNKGLHLGGAILASREELHER